MEYSPGLALLTGIVEAGTAVWIFLSGTPGRKRILQPIGLILLLLAGYQFAEVTVCFRPENLLYSRLAFLDITWLPPLGLWLCAEMAFPKQRWLKAAAWADIALALGLSIWIFADPGAITKSVCMTVIASYSHAGTFEIAYGLFYQSSLVLTVFGAAAGMASIEDAVRRKHLANLQTGILGFLFPALAVRIVLAEPEGLLPSVMCHFAVVLAVSLFFAARREKRAARNEASGR